MRFVERQSSYPLFDYDYLETLTERDRNRLASKAARYILEMGIPQQIPFKYSAIIMIGMVLGDEKGILLGEQTFIDDIIAMCWREEMEEVKAGRKNINYAIECFVDDSIEYILNELVKRNIYAESAKGYYYDYRNIMTLEYMATL